VRHVRSELWSFDRIDEPVLEVNIIIVNRNLLPQPSLTSPSVFLVDSGASLSRKRLLSPPCERDTILSALRAVSSRASVFITSRVDDSAKSRP